MNMSCDTSFIKQEFPNTEEEFISIINTSIKNEPFFEESFPSIAIKNEFPHEEKLLEGVNTITTLQSQKIVTNGKDNFIIYELETPPAYQKLSTVHEKNGQGKLGGPCRTTPQSHISNITQIKEISKRNKSLVSNLNQSNVKDKTVNNVKIPTKTPPPILLNTQLRKRHKVILPANPIDKRTRYNIQETTHPLIEKIDPIANTNRCRLLNTGTKKIINHFIKLGKPIENSVSIESQTVIRKHDNQDNKIKVASTIREKNSSIVSSNNGIKTATKGQTQSPSSMSISEKNISSSSCKPSEVSPKTSEIRVKRLCSLTNDITTDSIELKSFFKQMYHETRCLNKTQQRKIKMLLLKAICDAEDLTERGIC